MCKKIFSDSSLDEFVWVIMKASIHVVRLVFYICLYLCLCVCMFICGVLCLFVCLFNLGNALRASRMLCKTGTGQYP